MNEETLRRMLEDVRSGRLDLDGALHRLRDLPYEDLGYARLDHHRALRTGMPEAVFCQGKTPEQVAEIFVRLAARHVQAIGTRASEEAASAVRARLPDATYHPVARMILHVPRGVDAAGPGGGARGGTRPVADGEDQGRREPVDGEGPIVLVCAAGTSDIPVAEEAALTAEVLGCSVTRLWDVGVAGLHRLLDHRRLLSRASVVVAVAGMEGALASIVAGLVACPVIAVPTSIGYGASFGGLAALLTMVNSCAPGVSVVNIDNGFGAGVIAHRIVSRPEPPSPRRDAGAV